MSPSKITGQYSTMANPNTDVAMIKPKIFNDPSGRNDLKAIEGAQETRSGDLDENRADGGTMITGIDADQSYLKKKGEVA